MDIPTIDNVLFKWKKWVWRPSKKFAELGAIAAMPGGMACPWCNSNMIEEGQSFLVICEKDSRHIVQWCPWGG